MCTRLPSPPLYYYIGQTGDEYTIVALLGGGEPKSEYTRVHSESTQVHSMLLKLGRGEYTRTRDEYTIVALLGGGESTRVHSVNSVRSPLDPTRFPRVWGLAECSDSTMLALLDHRLWLFGRSFATLGPFRSILARSRLHFGRFTSTCVDVRPDVRWLCLQVLCCWSRWLCLQVLCCLSRRLIVPRVSVSVQFCSLWPTAKS